MGARRLFSVGDLNVDVLQSLGAGPAFGEEHLLKGLVFSIGGCAANFAVVAAKAGLAPFLVSVLGDDFATPFLQKGLSEAGVRPVLLRSPKKNSFSMVLVKKGGERAILSVKNCFEDATAKKFSGLLLPKVRAGDIVCFGGFYNLETLRPGFENLLGALKKKRAVVCFDTSFDPQGKWGIGRFFPFIDYLFVNGLELKKISCGKTNEQRAGLLFKKGCNAVVLKQGARGASLFVKGFPPRQFAPLKVKAVDTTGAGDAFNAGFAFGLMQGWGLDNCMRAALFVAAHKVRVHGPAAPPKAAIGRFVSLNNKPTLIRVKNRRAMSEMAVQRVANLLKRKPNASIALPTGETPRQMYALLVKAYRDGKADFSKAHFFSLDEYAGLGKADKSSFSHYLLHHFFGKVNAKKENIRLLDGAAGDLKVECARHEAAIKKKGIDLFILGIGRNGHVAFNEPGSGEHSATCVVNLSRQTRRVNGKGFPKGLAPERALTVGLGTIRENSGNILLLASGGHKKGAVSALLAGGNPAKCPAAALRTHKNFMVVADGAAAGKKAK